MPSKKKISEPGQVKSMEKADIESFYGRDLFEQLPVGMALLKLNGEFLDVNSKLCGMIGYSREELLKLNLTDIISDETEEHDKTLTGNLIRNGNFGPYEMQLIHKDGNVVPARLEGNTKGKNGIELLLLNIIDLSEQKFTESKLRESEEKYRRLIKYSPVGMVILKHGKICFANTVLANTLGYESVDEIIDMPMISFIHPDYVEVAKERLMTLFSREGTTVKTIEEKFLTSEGRELDVMVVGHSIIFEGSIAVQGYIFDITESKRAQKEIKDSEERFRALIDSAADAFFLSDFEGNIIQVNQTACESLGYTREELLSMKVSDVDINFIVDQHQQEMWTKLSPGNPVTVESTHRRKDNSLFPVEVNIGILNLKGQNSILGFARNISERKKAEERLNKLNRIYAVISQINQMIVRTHDFTEILEKSCEISLEFGNFQYAWISLANEEDQIITQAAARGEAVDQIPSLLTISTSGSSEGNEIILKVLREGEFCFCNDIVSDLAAGPLRDEANDSGFKSIIILPLKTFDKTIGLFALFSSQLNFFDEEEIKLLEEVATDISFALQAAELERFRENAEKALRDSEKSLRMVLEGSNDGFWDWNLKTGIVNFSSRWAEMLGYTADEIMPHVSSWEKTVHPEDKAFVMKLLTAHLNGETPKFEAEYRVRTKSGEWLWILDRGKVVEYDSEGKAIRAAGTHTDISARKLNEQLLHESQEKFRTAFMTSPDSMVLSTLKEGRFVEVNESFTRITGYTKEDVVNKTVDDVNIWYDKNDREKLILGLKKAGLVVNQEAKFVLKDGSVIDGLISASLLMINNQAHLIAGTRDISHLKAAEIELRKSREEYRMFFEQDLTGDFISSLDGELITCNPAYLKILGYKSFEEAKQSGVVPFYPDPGTREIMLEVLREKRIIENYRLTMQRADGKVLYLIENIVGKFNDYGELEYIQGYILDNTERTFAEEELRKLSRAVQQSPASIIITNTHGQIEYVNPKFSEITGYSQEDVKGKNPSILKSGYTSSEVYKTMWVTIRDGNTWHGELLNKRKDGTLYWSSVSISAVKNSRGEVSHYLAVEEDITAAKNYQKQLIEAKEKAEKSDNLKSEFLAQMSHEIRSPIQVILSFISLLEEEVKDKIEPELMSSFKSIHSSSSRIIRTIDAILNMSELQTGTYEAVFKEVDLISKVLHPLMHEYEQLAKAKSINLRLDVIAKDCMIMADEYSVIQIFSNLLDNAIKYTPIGYVKVSVFTNSNLNLVVEVEDSGIGISNEFLPHLFDPFLQEEQGYTRSFEGNGLGLALVKKYCELNKAIISAESEKGKGSVFRVEFFKH